MLLNEPLHINGDVTINGNLRINGRLIVSGELNAGKISVNGVEVAAAATPITAGQTLVLDGASVKPASDLKPLKNQPVE